MKAILTVPPLVPLLAFLGTLPAAAQSSSTQATQAMQAMQAAIAQQSRAIQAAASPTPRPASPSSAKEERGNPEPSAGSSLHDAAIKGDTAEIRRLLAGGAKINAKNKKGDTPLSLAAFYCHPEAVELLLEKGASDAIYKEQNIPSLVWMVNAGLTARVQKALDEGADESIFQQRGTPVTAWTASAGLLDRLKLELAKGADVNAFTKGGYTPLIVASRFNRPDIVQLLLEYGASVNTKASDGRSALRLAAVCGRGHPGIVRLLLEHGADANIRDAQGVTPLLAAASVNSTEVIKLLLENGADLFAQDKAGHTALEIARQSKSAEAAAFLTRAEQQASGRLDYWLAKTAFDDEEVSTGIIAAKNQWLPGFIQDSTPEQRVALLTLVETRMMQAKTRIEELNAQAGDAIRQGQGAASYRKRVGQIQAYISILKAVGEILNHS